jgi:hypothetical protein
MATFGAAVFGVRITGTDRTTEAEVTKMHIPGSDINVLDKGGLLSEPLTYELYFTSDTAYDNLRALVNTSATLTTYDFTGTAYLQRLQRTFINPVGGYATTARAEFIA